MHPAGRDLLVPATVVAEVGYLLAREAGPRVEALFLTALAEGDFQPVDLTAVDLPATTSYEGHSLPVRPRLTFLRKDQARPGRGREVIRQVFLPDPAGLAYGPDNARPTLPRCRVHERGSC